jgi:VWFA-related protein
MRPIKSILASALLLGPVLFYCVSLSAQNPQSPPASSSTSTPTVSVYSREVVLDINVTDAGGKPVHGLTKENFTVLEDGKPMALRSFREHQPEQPPDTTANPSQPPNTFTNAGAPETVRALYLLMLDSMDTPVATQSIVQKDMVDFVDKVPAGTQLAVLSLSATGQLSLIQGFSTDTALLRKAIKSHKFDLQIPPLEDSGQDQARDVGPELNAGKRAAARPERQEKVDLTLECNHAADRGQYTVNAMIAIARYLSGLPGRKNLMWYSGAFPDTMKDKQGTQCYDMGKNVLVAVEMLQHSNVHVYPVDPRALDIIAKEGPESRIVRIVTREHLMMERIAQPTNGKTFYNNNDLAAGAQQAIEAGSNYYSVAYTPVNQVWDTRARTISVKVDQPDLTLVYRHGYHAALPGTTVTGVPVEKASFAQTAMMRGTLPPTEIEFHVSATPAAATDTSLPPGNTADPKAMKPPYRHLSLVYSIDLKGIQFDQGADGNYHGQFEFAVFVYDPHDGRLLNSSTIAARPGLPLAAYQSMLSTGAKARQEIDLPATGDYILRVGVHDMSSDRVGAIEFPVSAIAPAVGPKP